MGSTPISSTNRAGVAELADAIDLGSIGNTVQVQVLSPAPKQNSPVPDWDGRVLLFVSFYHFHIPNAKTKKSRVAAAIYSKGPQYKTNGGADT